MTTAAKVVQCIAGLSRASSSPTAILQRGLTSQLPRSFTSSSGKDGEVAVKADIKNPRIDASNFMNKKTRPKPAEVGVGNCLRADVIMSPSIGVPKQAKIIDKGSRRTHLDIPATTPIGPCVLHATLPIHTSLNENSHLHTHSYDWEAEKVIHTACEHVAKLNEANPEEILFTSRATGSGDTSIEHVARLGKSKKHTTVSQTEHKCVFDLCRHLQDEGYDIMYPPVENNGLVNLKHLGKAIHLSTAGAPAMMVNNEIMVMQQMEKIGKLFRKQGVFFHTDGAQATDEIPVEVGKWGVDWMSISSAKVYILKYIRACCIRCGLKVRIHPIISSGGQEHGLPSGTLAYSFVIGPGEARRLGTAQVGIEYTRTSEPFSPLNSTCSPAVRSNYPHKLYHNKQPQQFTRTFQTMGHNKADTKKGKSNATTKDSGVGIQQANVTKVRKGRNRKWTTSYSIMTIPEAEIRLNVPLTLPGIPVKEMLEGKRVLLGPDLILRAKREVYKGLVRYLAGSGYPTEADPDFKEANINDIVVFTIYPMLELFRDEAMRTLHLSREKEIISKDSSTSGMEEFVVMDYISLNQRKYVLIVEAKKVSLGEARKQCFLSLKDMWDYNGGGTVYGFVTMGDMWRMVSFDGKFQMSEPVLLLFDSMGKSEERWMADYSILVDCFNVALSHGGKDPVKVA